MELEPCKVKWDPEALDSESANIANRKGGRAGAMPRSAEAHLFAETHRTPRIILDRLVGAQGESGCREDRRHCWRNRWFEGTRTTSPSN